jgi:NTP pyrophosphatase (non-canonical NTP hydrolase)
MQKFLDTVLKNIPEIQNEFDKYQKEYFPVRTPQFFCLELNGEAGELANLEKKIWKGREINEEQLVDEAADVFIALMNYANSRRINLGSAVKNKLQIIDTKMREMKQEGKEY